MTEQTDDLVRAMDWDEAASALMDAWLQNLPVLQPKEQTDVA